MKGGAGQGAVPAGLGLFDAALPFAQQAATKQVAIADGLNWPGLRQAAEKSPSG